MTSEVGVQGTGRFSLFSEEETKKEGQTDDRGDRGTHRMGPDDQPFGYSRGLQSESGRGDGLSGVPQHLSTTGTYWIPGLQVQSAITKQ
ncbi:unnamed protein product [Gadus morhua 'NCC']